MAEWRYTLSFALFYNVVYPGNTNSHQYEIVSLLLDGVRLNTIEGTPAEAINQDMASKYCRGSKPISKIKAAAFRSLPEEDVIQRVHDSSLSNAELAVEILRHLIVAGHISMPTAVRESLLAIPYHEDPYLFLARALMIAVDCPKEQVARMTDEILSDIARTKSSLLDGTIEDQALEETVPIEVSSGVSGSRRQQSSLLHNSPRGDSHEDIFEEGVVDDPSTFFDSSEFNSEYERQKAVTHEAEEQLTSWKSTLAEAQHRLDAQVGKTREAEALLEHKRAAVNRAQAMLAEEERKQHALSERREAVKAELHRIEALTAEAKGREKNARLTLSDLSDHPKKKKAPSLGSASSMMAYYSACELDYAKDRERYKTELLHLNTSQPATEFTEEDIVVSRDIFRRSDRTFLIQFEGSLSGMTDVLLHRVSEKNCMQIVFVGEVRSKKEFFGMRNVLKNILDFALVDDGRLFVACGFDPNVPEGNFRMRIIYSLKATPDNEKKRLELVTNPPVLHLMPAEKYEGRVPDYLLPFRPDRG